MRTHCLRWSAQSAAKNLFYFAVISRDNAGHKNWRINYIIAVVSIRTICIYYARNVFIFVVKRIFSLADYSSGDELHFCGTIDRKELFDGGGVDVAAPVCFFECLLTCFDK